MALKVSDYPRSQYDGYFETVDGCGALESEYRSAMDQAVAGNADAMERAAALKRRLDATPAGGITARIYGKEPPANGAGMAKEFSHILAAEFTGTSDEVEAFVASEMAKLKKAVQ